MCGALNNVICDSLKLGVLLNCSVVPTVFSLENFKNGGELAVQNLQEYFETSNLFSLAKDKLQSYQMMFIKQITLVNQAAVSAGVSATFANTVNDYFIERMLTATDRDGINGL